MKTFAPTISIILLLTFGVPAQIQLSDQMYQVFDGKGNQSSIDAIVQRLDNAEVVFLGELHNDAVGHAVQLEIFKRTLDSYLAKRNIALSLEMFERDVQVVLDEYLSGQISEAHFMSSSRPWGNYRTDYRPLVELAKEKRLPVFAANAPRRYVNMVSRNGRDALNGLSKQAKSWLPPLPFNEPSPAYAAKFKALMGQSPEAQMGVDKILASQSLWDASMAYVVAEYLDDHKRGLVVHLNGGFHTEGRLGTVDHLLKYRSKARAIVVTMKYEDDFRRFDPAKHMDLGDFVVLTDAKQPRSQR